MFSKRESENEVVLSCVGAASLLVLIPFIGALLSGLVIKMLWLWYVVPLFGLPELRIFQAFGLALIVSYMSFQYNPRPKEVKKAGWEDIIAVFLRPAWVLFVGWAFHFWV